MKFAPTPAALALTEARGLVLKAIANWTMKRRRYREPTPMEKARAGLTDGARVVRDEGLLFIADPDMIHVYTLKELGL